MYAAPLSSPSVATTATTSTGADDAPRHVGLLFLEKIGDGWLANPLSFMDTVPDVARFLQQFEQYENTRDCYSTWRKEKLRDGTLRLRERALELLIESGAKVSQFREVCVELELYDLLWRVQIKESDFK